MMLASRFVFMVGNSFWHYRGGWEGLTIFASSLRQLPGFVSVPFTVPYEQT
jgi:hypothetical protein